MNNTIEIRCKNVFIGDAYKEVDGYYIFCAPPNNDASCWTSDVLRFIADTLDSLNQQWDEKVKRDMAKHQSRHRLWAVARLST